MKRTPFVVGLFAIIIVGFLVSWIFIASKNSEGSVKVESKKINQKGNPIIQSESKKETTLGKMLDEISEAKKSSENKTQQLVRDMTASFMARLDPGAGTSSDDIERQMRGIMDEKTLETIIENTKKEFLEDVPDATFVKTIGNDYNTLVLYKKEYEACINDFSEYAYNGKEILNVLQNSESNGSSKVTEEIKSIIQRFKNIQVPQQALSLHKKTYVVLQNTYFIFSAIATGQTDPLRAYVATEHGFPLVVNQSEAMGKLYNTFIKENKL